jgi:translation initiation factor 1 (eIF-1/SUI1)
MEKERRKVTEIRTENANVRIVTATESARTGIVIVKGIATGIEKETETVIGNGTLETATAATIVNERNVIQLGMRGPLQRLLLNCH